MKIINVVQGSAEWLALRAHARRRCASDAPVMMGVSPNVSRSELVRMKATGDEREFSEWVRDNILEKGHEVEALARVIAEREMGEDLFPVTATDDDGVHLASFDGLTMAEEDAWEHKQWNEELAAAIRAKEPPASLYWQLEHQLLVGKGVVKRVRVTVSDGTKEKRVEMVYEPVRGRREQLIRGWVQFEEDVANYQHVEVAPKAVAHPTMALPALLIDVTGEVSLVSNLDKFGERLKGFIAEIPLKPATDQDFADCESAITTLETAQKKLEAAESNALAQFATIDDMRRTVAMYAELSRSTRLMLEKLVKARKDEIRDETRRGGAEAFAAHITKLNERLGGTYMPIVPAKFADVMKGKKTITSLRDAVATELARLKIESNEIADRIDLNLKALVEHATGFEQLFPDKQQIVCKASDDFVNLVKSRVAEQKQKVEADRERIRQEEAARLATPAVQTSARPAAPVLAMAPRAGPPPAGAVRPTAEYIVRTVADAFDVSEVVAVAWLLESDFKAVGQSLAAEA